MKGHKLFVVYVRVLNGLYPFSKIIHDDYNVTFLLRLKTSIYN